MTRDRAYVVRLDLGSAHRDDVLVQISPRSVPHEPVISERDTGLELTLRVEAGDIWHAVLLAMAATTNLGFPVRRLHAHPT